MPSEKKLIRTILVLLLTGSFVFWLYACNGSGGGSTDNNSGDDNDGDGDTQPASYSQLVTAATGGTVSDPSGASIIIPANALGQDTTISVTTYGNGAGIDTVMPLNGSVDFEPDGLVFNAPVTITIPCQSAMTPGETFPLWLYDKTFERWEPTDFMATVAADGMSYSAPVTHFTVYSYGPGQGAFDGFEEKFSDCDLMTEAQALNDLFQSYVLDFRSDHYEGQKFVGADGKCYEVTAIHFALEYFSMCTQSGDFLENGSQDGDSDKVIIYYFNREATETNANAFDFWIRMYVDCTDPDFQLGAGMELSESTTVKLDETLDVNLYHCECGVGNEMYLGGDQTVRFSLNGPGAISRDSQAIGADAFRASTTYTANAFGTAEVVAETDYDCFDFGDSIQDTVTIKVKGTADLVFSHALSNNYGNCGQTEMVSGAVLFTVSGNTVLGGGGISTAGGGVCGECTTSISGEATVMIEGTIPEAGSRTVPLSITELWTKTITTVCGDDPPATTIMPATITYDLEVPFEDGHVIEQPYGNNECPSCSGTYTWTVDVQ